MTHLYKPISFSLQYYQLGRKICTELQSLDCIARAYPDAAEDYDEVWESITDVFDSNLNIICRVIRDNNGHYMVALSKNLIPEEDHELNYDDINRRYQKLIDNLMKDLNIPIILLTSSDILEIYIATCIDFTTP